MEALKKSLAEKQTPAAASAAEAPVGKKPPARAVQPISSVPKRAGRRQPVKFNMGATDRFTAEDVPAHCGSDRKALEYWIAYDRLSAKEQGNRFYDFRDLIGLRTVKQLVEEGVPANRCVVRLPRSAKTSHTQAPLAELRVFPTERYPCGTRRRAPRAALRQFALNFETRELERKCV